MFRDRFDNITLLLLALFAAGLVFLLAGERTPAGARGGGLDKAAAREMAYRARLELIGKLYAPVEALRREGQGQTALLKLDQINRNYPGEAHGKILLGEILLESGTLEEALTAYVEGVKLNGDYLDPKSPLTRRPEIERLVERGVKEIGAKAAANPGNRSLAQSLGRVQYLKSRLAGGCE